MPFDAPCVVAGKRCATDANFQIFLYVFAFVFVAGFAIWLVASNFDRQRIAEYIESRGGKVIEARWAPFGPGWLGGNKERCYEVRYRDQDGNIHHAFVRTNMLSGVFFTEDNIVHRLTQATDENIETLEADNARLRAELERIKRKDHDRGSDAIKE